MRPLVRPMLSSTAAETVPTLDLLMRAFGTYCCFSEEPIFDVAAVWCRGADGEGAAARPPGDGWNDALLVSPATLAAARCADGPRKRALLFPDRDLTFSLDASSFSYALEPVEITLVDEEGRPESVDRVLLAVVRGATRAARATIDAFALNTAGFSAAKNTLRMPTAAFLAREDNRLFLRTEVWGRAEEAAGLIAQVDGPSRSSFLEAVRMLAAASGFWSVWATVLWNRFGDRDLLAQVLLPPQQPSDRARVLAADATDAGDDRGPSVHDAFPGTRPDWLYEG